MWTPIVGHVETLGEASRQYMSHLMGLRMLRRGLWSHERLLRGHDREVGHSADEPKSAIRR
jgi:hypothetical protein